MCTAPLLSRHHVIEPYNLYRIRSQSRSLFANLMFIALIPFSTSLLGEYQNQQISVLIYGANLIISLCWNYLHWWYATKDHRLVDSDLDPILITVISRRYLVGIIIFLVVIAVSFINIHVSLVLYIGAPLYYLIPIQKHKSWTWFTKNK